MPLKGVLLQQLVYQDPADRVLSDTDLLLPHGRYEDAVRALGKAGHRIVESGRTGVATKGPKALLEVDLHSRLYSPGLFSLGVRGLFARGRIDERSFDAVVVVPDPLDTYAHLVGNFAKGRHVSSDTMQLRDFSAVASRFGLSPSAVAQHLRRHGLARAAHYALGHASRSSADRRPDKFAAQVLKALPKDAIGRVSAAAARTISERYGSWSSMSAVAPHLVNRSLPRGAASAVVHAVLGIRSKFQLKLIERRDIRQRGIRQRGDER